MKRTFIISLALCTSLYAKAQYVAVDTTKLAQAYAAWQQESSPANQRVFFDAFPKNWMEFIATYQYGAPFYDRADKHVHALGEMAKAIPTDEYCERLVNLCIGGELDADAPNYLRELVGEALFADSESRKGDFHLFIPTAYRASFSVLVLLLVEHRPFTDIGSGVRRSVCVCEGGVSRRSRYHG